ncbi:hypothetical protein HRbin40_01192 [bacterium HR40]|nr:hypothetical protein HRbin40_01192 [bacterium HR40]
MHLTLGPILFHWPTRQWADFYARIADEAPVDRVVVGEVVCAKREPFQRPVLEQVVERLQAAGKEVMRASLALPTLPRERQELARLVEGRLLVEINDLTALRFLRREARFAVGPLVNVYNESTLRLLARRGAIRLCLPPELPLPSIEHLAAEARTLGVDIELWAFGRVPLAISGRCYHARLSGRSRDSCLLVCGRDADGLTVTTLDGEPIFALNGVQTLSAAWANLAGDVDILAKVGVSGLRLSPHSCDMVAVARIFRAVCDGRWTAEEALASLAELVPGVRFANGALAGMAGASWQLRSTARAGLEPRNPDRPAATRVPARPLPGREG